MLIAVDYSTFVSIAGTFGSPVFYATTPTFKCVTNAGQFVIQFTTATQPTQFSTDFPSAYAVDAITY